MASVTVFDIKRFAVHDGPGIRTTVFMKGCPMDCWWCHNPESRKREPEEVTYTRKLGDKDIESKITYGKKWDTRDLIKEVLKDRVFHEESGGGVTFSGGEPLYQVEALLELLMQCKKHKLHTTVDTCGYAHWSSYEKIMPFTDLFLYDLKLTDEGDHKKFTGVKNELIVDNLIQLLNNQANVELRIPIIPGVNDSQEEIVRYIDLLQHSVKHIPKIHLLPYHSIADNKYLKLNLENRMAGLANDSEVGIEGFKTQLESAGLTVGIGG